MCIMVRTLSSMPPRGWKDTESKGIYMDAPVNSHTTESPRKLNKFKFTNKTKRAQKSWSTHRKGHSRNVRRGVWPPGRRAGCTNSCPRKLATGLRSQSGQALQCHPLRKEKPQRDNLTASRNTHSLLHAFVFVYCVCGCCVWVPLLGSAPEVLWPSPDSPSARDTGAQGYVLLSLGFGVGAGGGVGPHSGPNAWTARALTHWTTPRHPPAHSWSF